MANLISKLQEAGKKIGDKLNEKTKEREEKALREEQEFLKKFPFKHRVFLYSQLDQESFVVLDENEMPVYSVMSGIVFDEHHFTVRDKNKKVVGRIKKTFINPRIPGLYGKYRRCIIKISGEEKFGVSYEVGGDYGLYDTNMSLSANADETIFTITGCKNGKIKIGKQKGTSLLSQSRYVIGYDDEKNELRAIFIAICIRILRH